MRVLATGASGFVGRGLLERMALSANFDVLAALRTQVPYLPTNVTPVQVGNLEGKADCWAALAGVETVIHAAARVHVMNDRAAEPLAEFREVNVAGTLNLARQAVSSGVKRFIFISSIKVNGEGTSLGEPYTADTSPAPTDPYGISKLEAEQALLALAAETGMEVVIIRPVLVYGPGVKANFLNMMRWLSKGVPLPLGAIHNKRSLVALDNLVDLIVTCIEHPSAVNQVFLVSDGEDLSTSELLRRMGRALGKPARLIPIPAGVLEMGARMVGKKTIAQRLCGSLQVDISKTRELLNWSPPMSVDCALARTARYFIEQQ